MIVIISKGEKKAVSETRLCWFNLKDQPLALRDKQGGHLPHGNDTVSPVSNFLANGLKHCMMFVLNNIEL